MLFFHLQPARLHLLAFFCFAHFSFFAFHAQPALVHFFSFFCFLQEVPEEATHCPFFHSQPPAFLQGFLSAFGALRS